MPTIMEFVLALITVFPRKYDDCYGVDSDGWNKFMWAVMLVSTQLLGGSRESVPIRLRILFCHTIAKKYMIIAKYVSVP